MSRTVCITKGTPQHRWPLSLGKPSNLASGALWLAAALAAVRIIAQPAPLTPDCRALSAAPCRPPAPLIVIGFLGGHVHAGNLVHREARLARDLERRYPNAVQAMAFANRDQPAALHFLFNLLDTDHDGRLSDSEKTAARIILYGHSWGASEVVNLAQELDRRGIPVLLTIQVDSVCKHGEHDGSIPANVREAINFYQTEGMLHGRRSIQAIDPQRTTILGNYESTYKLAPVSCAGFPWFARTFMKPHIEIENDVAVWDRIDTLIVARSCATNPAETARSCSAISAAPRPQIGLPD
jgi:hypothetical protein